jgi:hypothetical protein
VIERGRPSAPNAGITGDGIAMLRVPSLGEEKGTADMPAELCSEGLVLFF